MGAGAVPAGLPKDSARGKRLWDDETAHLPLSLLSGMIRNEEISSRRIVEIYPDRIRKFDGQRGINAYITVAADSAPERAEELDGLAKKRKFKGPLHGLPVALKDNIDTLGSRTTAGSKILASWVPPTDANVVKKLPEPLFRVKRTCMNWPLVLQTTVLTTVRCETPMIFRE